MRLFVWAQVGRGAVEGADVRLAVRAMATDMGWAAPMMRKATAKRFGGGTTHRKGESLRLEASDGRFGVSRSEEHTSELQAIMRIAYAGCCMKIKTNKR